MKEEGEDGPAKRARAEVEHNLRIESRFPHMHIQLSQTNSRRASAHYGLSRRARLLEDAILAQGTVIPPGPEGGRPPR